MIQMLVRRQVRIFSDNLLHVPRRDYAAQSVKKPQPAKLLLKKQFLEIVDSEIVNIEDKPRLKNVERHLIQSVNSVLRQTPASRVELMQYVWKEAEKKGFTFNVHQINNVLNFLGFLRLPFEPVDFRESMEGIEPNNYTHRLLIRLYAQRGEPEIVRRLMEHTDSKSIFSHGWLMHAYIRNGDTQSAQNVEENFLAIGKVKPDISLYNPAISVYAELGNVGAIENIFAKMTESGIPPTIETYIEMFESFTIGSHPQLFDSAVQNTNNMAMLADYFEPLIRRCVIRGHYSAASKLLSCVEWDKERLQIYEDNIKASTAYISSKKRISGSPVSSQVEEVSASVKY